MKVDTTHPDYNYWVAEWAKCRTVAAGARAIKAAGATYLPPLGSHEGPGDEAYKAYLARALFYSATSRTIDALTGLVFRKAPMIEAADVLVDDPLLSGKTLRQFADVALEEVLLTNRFGVLVNYSTESTEGMTIAQAESENARAVLVPYTAESIINWRYTTVNRRRVLSMVVLKEMVDKATDGFESDMVAQYLVLDLEPESGRYRQRRFEKNGGDFTLVSEHYPVAPDNKVFTEIPFFICSENGADELAEPPLADLCEVNLAHYRTSADYEHGVHFCGLPTLFGTGFKMEEGQSFPIGSAQIYTTMNAEAKVEFLEFQGAGLGEVVTNLERKEKMMAALGARLLQEAPRQVETASALNLKQNSENSILASVANAVSDTLTQALTLASEWSGLGDNAVIELNTDFQVEGLDPQMITALLAGVQQGKISTETFLYNLKRGEILADDVSIEDEMDRTEGQDLPPVTGGFDGD